MAGKLIVLEGTDGSGKSTQKQLLVKHLTERGIQFRELTFPRYGEESSALIRMYLSGDFGEKPGDVSPKAASVFYAVDRYASYKTDWGDFYESGGLIISDRYTTSNAVHQTPKLPEDQWWGFTEWLFEFEHQLMGLPRPDCVIFLDMPTEHSLKLIDKRQGHSGDIHELDHSYLKQCRECAVSICEKYGWNIVPCTENGSILGVTEISHKILKIVLENI